MNTLPRPRATSSIRRTVGRADAASLAEIAFDVTIEPGKWLPRMEETSAEILGPDVTSALFVYQTAPAHRRLHLRSYAGPPELEKALIELLHAPPANSSFAATIPATSGITHEPFTLAESIVGPAASSARLNVETLTVPVTATWGLKWLMMRPARQSGVLPSAASLRTMIPVLAAGTRVRHHFNNDVIAPPARSGQSSGVADLFGAFKELDGATNSDLWQLLLDGRLSLLCAERTGTEHQVIARLNDANTRDPRALTAREHEVTQRLLGGVAEKVVAMDLDLSPTTVSVHATRAFRKLGIRSASQLITRRDTMQRGRFSRLRLPEDELLRWTYQAAASIPGGEPPSPSEYHLICLLGEGLSRHEIAKVRGTSPNTISNQLLRLYRKHSVSSASELLRVLGGKSKQAK